MARQAAMGVEELLHSMRHWKKTKPVKRTHWDFQFTVMTYNILSQTAVENHMYLYRNCSPAFLQEDYRISRIIPEILRSRSDIICLQEVEQHVFDNRMKKVFDSNGFASVFKRRTGCKSDGCAILWKRRKFDLVGHQDVEFLSKGNHLLDRDNVGLIAVLKPIHPKSRNTLLHVATTHLLFNPRRGDIKLCQVRWLLAELERMSLKGVVDGNRHYHPVVLCGDFNFEPFSPLYKFVEGGCIDVENTLSGDLTGQAEGKKKGKLMRAEDLVLFNLGISNATRFEKTPNDGVTGEPVLKLPRAESGSIDPTAATDPRFIPNVLALGNRQLALELSARIQKAASSGSGQNSPVPDYPKKMEEDESNHCFYHDFKFVPAYKYHYMHPKNIPITSMTGNDFNNVDHIFYNVKKKTDVTTFSEGQLRLVSVYSLLYPDDAKDLGGLPNAALGSDHISLMARFAFSFNR